MRRNMTFKKLLNRHLLILCALGGLQSCSAQTEATKLNWPTECVGRMQFQLPGPADVAALPPKLMLTYIKEPGLINGFAFSDGAKAYFSKIPPITHPLSEIEKESMRAAALAYRKRVTDNYLERKSKGLVFNVASNLPSPPFDDKSTFGWLSGNGVIAYRVIGNSLTKWDEDLKDVDLIVNAQPRATFDVPKDQGLCLPYIFVPDDGSGGRNFSVSYRLKDHPDIQITLTDSSAYNPRHPNALVKESEDQIKLFIKKAEPEAEIGYFWLERLNAARKYESQWLLPPFTRSVTIAGFEGRQSFMRLTMDDGTLNYG